MMGKYHFHRFHRSEPNDGNDENGDLPGSGHIFRRGEVIPIQCRPLGDDRTSIIGGLRSVHDPGCVKTSVNDMIPLRFG